MILCATFILVAMAIMIGYLCSKKVVTRVLPTPERVNTPRTVQNNAAEVQPLGASFWNVNQASVAQATAHHQNQAARFTLTAANARATQTRNYHEAPASQTPNDEPSLAPELDVVVEGAPKYSTRTDSSSEQMIEPETQDETHPPDPFDEPADNYGEINFDRDVIIESLQLVSQQGAGGEDQESGVCKSRATEYYWGAERYYRRTE